MTEQEILDAITAANLSLDGYDYVSAPDFFRFFCVEIVNELTLSNSFIGAMPDSPAFCAAFYDSGGAEQSANPALDTYTVQIRTRGNYRESNGLLRKIKVALQSIRAVTLADGSKLVGVWITSNIAMIGRDEQERSLFTLNLRTIIEPIDKGHRR